ncbi:MAG TPA: hypothetical protein VGM80_05460 [Gaiellaceae bacterium]
MIDVDEALREALDDLTAPVPPPDWDAVLARAGSRSAARRRRAGFAVVLIATVGVLWIATPLGATIADGVGGFSSWLSGQPGTPASKSDQDAFDRANARSWLGFPAGTKLRQLDRLVDPATGKTVNLLGFRSGDSLCLRVVVSRVTRGGTQACAPLASLRQAGAPVRVVLVDWGIGKGTKRAWYGLNRLTAPALRVTAGIAADTVKSVTVRDERGSHIVRVRGNAFLYVAVAPDVSQRVQAISAHTSSGTVSVPFAPSLFGFGNGVPGGRLSGPTGVQRRVAPGTIGWLEDRKPVGRPLTVLARPARRIIERHTVFGRIVAPDPGLPYRVALTLSTSRHGGKATGLCTWVISPNGGFGGGCRVRADVFAGGPITSGTGMSSGSQEYSLQSGLASDDVARITAYLSGGGTQPVSLHDNVFLASLPRAGFPVRLVAYDASGKIIGIQTLRGEPSGPSPAAGPARLLRRVDTATGGYAELSVGPSTTGGTCMYVKWFESKRATGIEESCDAGPRGAVLSLSTNGNPANLVLGRVPGGTASVVLVYADGTRTTIHPLDGYVLYAVPKPALAHGHTLVGSTALDAHGDRIATESFVRPR